MMALLVLGTVEQGNQQGGTFLALVLCYPDRTSDAGSGPSQMEVATQMSRHVQVHQLSTPRAVRGPLRVC